ncbi:MAG: alpha-glucosidase [Pseudonocardiales bacterium]|jgi:alpha-glucosidase|nr:alpha-glucosidase [Pseudonocardiales bacterium]
MARVTLSAFTERPWWATAVFYQVYPRSFADGNGDGTGDLIGLRERLDHLVDLGVDALWLSPFFRSPMADGGYDVADPCDVDPMFGTLADFDVLLADAHARGIKITIDIVPNHFSSEHPWFRAVLAGGPDAPERSRFVIHPGRGPDGAQPPNNWPSVFGGPAWTRLPDGDWYLHLFAPEQPDLNWDDPVVPAEFERIMRFWLDRGVDGFRVDVAHSMAKEPGLPDMDLSVLPGTDGPMPSVDDIRWDRDPVHDFHRHFRRVLDSYPGDRMAVGEAWVADAERLALYVRPDELNLTFNFELVEASWGADAFRGAIERSLAGMAGVGAPCTWVLDNHDVDRAATRYGGGARGGARARAAALVQLSLPGAAYVYNGDELGLENVDLPDEALQDPTWERSGHTERGRDGERVPLPWSGTTPPFGFTTGHTTWLPMPASWAGLTVQAQEADPDSTLHLYRDTLRLRAELPDLHTAEFAWVDVPPGCVGYRRGKLTVVLNAGVDDAPLPAGELVHASGAVTDVIPPDTAVWIR